MIHNIFVDPYTKEKLVRDKEKLYNSSNSFEFIDEEIADLVWPKELHYKDYESLSFYEGRAEQYENTLHYTFYTHSLDENKTRKSFISKLNINKESKVLEIASGTGRDSVIIAEQLGENGELHVQDLSYDMLKICHSKLSKHNIKKSFSLSNALYLPYPDQYFDAVYSFGAIGEFSDPKKALKEMARVVKENGKIVVGDESVPEYLRETEFYKILHKTNKMFEATPPLTYLPIEARDVNLSYVLGNSFYLIDFIKGKGEPNANFDFEIPGFRGGTYRTRFEGELEGIKPKTKAKLYEYLKKKEISVHDWLEKIVSESIK
jgi:ubiquinone/menaquinone biosynthesis C-methylase UbiE